jgi:DNA-directed RNA polymerase specialized sigma24 family protein
LLRSWTRRTISRGDRLALLRRERRVAGLSDDKVRKLRARRADGLTYRQLAAEFGISDVSACAAVNRKTWAHVP